MREQKPTNAGNATGKIADRSKDDANPQDHSRQGSRRSVGWDGFALFEDGSTIPISIVDLSYDGCKIASSVALRPEDRFRVCYRGSVINAQVRWYSEGQAGLAFETESDLLAKKPTEQVPRDGTRIEAAPVAMLQKHGGEWHSISILDLSTHGCRVEMIEPAAVGETVHVKLEGLNPLEASVRWVSGSEAGVQFCNSIHPAVLSLLVRASSSETSTSD